jgi:hypothetical protein
MLMEKIDVFIPAGSPKPIKVGTGFKLLNRNYSELFEATGKENKAFIEFNGKSIISRVIETLDKSSRVSSITIGGQSKETLPLNISKPVYYVEGGETTFETVINILNFYHTWDNLPNYIMNVSSDLPLLKPEMINKIVESIDDNSDKEFYWNIIVAEDVYKNYPEIKKIPLKLIEGEFRFGDLHIMKPEVMKGREEIVEKIIGNRKKVTTVARYFGIGNMIKYIFKRLSFEDLKKTVLKRANFDAAVMITEFPETCIDLDYRSDLENFEKWLKAEPRKFHANEQVIILDNKADLERYLSSRNLNKK